jgi:hypothetical protein
LEVFNGDLGTVRAVDQTEQEVLLDLDDGRTHNEKRRGGGRR